MVQHAIGLNIGSVISRSFSYWGRNILAYSIIAVAIQLPVILFALFAPIQSKGQAWLYGSVVGFGPVALGLVTSSALAYGVFQQIRGQPAPIGDCLTVGFKRLFPVLGVSIVVGLVVLAGLLLFIVPGIILSCIFFVAVPVALVERAGVGEAMRRSARLTSGARAAIFGVSVVMGLITRGIGWIATAPFSKPNPPSRDLIGTSPELYVRQTLEYTQAALSAMRTEAVVSSVVQAVLGALVAIASVIVYYDLRVQKEQIDVEKMVEVFS
jgi:hypothetical protein